MIRARAGRTAGARGRSLRERIRWWAAAGSMFVGGTAFAFAIEPTATNADGSAVVDASFDRNMLSGAGKNVSDLSRFERGNFIAPGAYRVDIFLGSNWIGRSDVQFVAPAPNVSARPCLTGAMFSLLGLPLQKLSAEQQARLKSAQACLAIGELIPSASMSFDQTELRLDVSVPQAWLGTRARGYVSPENWDRGIPAGLLNYNFNTYRYRNAGMTQTSSFLGLNAGFNAGGWSLRQDSSWTMQSGLRGAPSTTRWQNLRTYLRRDLVSMRAQLTLGDSYTSGELFDSISIRGVQLATDDRMLPDSLRGYAPTVRGVAETNARVTIRQHGVTLYETTVAPGPFVISDLYPTGYGGNLIVDITEADGRVRTFSVPYASVPQLLRPGSSRFSFAAGQLHDSFMPSHPTLAQATYQRGLDNMFTGYAGVVGTQGYGAVQIGSALNTAYGALAVDLTQARTEIPGQSVQSGQSLRLSYSKIIPASDTSLTVAAYRYGTRGYLGLRDAIVARDGAHGYSYVDSDALATTDGLSAGTLLTPAQRMARQHALSKHPDTYVYQPDRQRNRFDISLNQRLGDHGGALYLTGSAVNYWNRRGADVQFHASYNNSIRRLNYSISATRGRDAYSRVSNQLFISLSLPLGNSMHAPTLSTNLSHRDNGQASGQLLVNGSFGEDSQFNYGANLSHDHPGNGEGNDTAGGLYAGYSSPFAQFNGSVGAGANYSQSSLNVAGSLVAHSGGITFGQSMGDTVAIVHAKDAAGARIVSASSARIDRFGYALVPYLSPYNLNTVQIDPKGLPLSTQLDATSAQVAPHAGAVVMVRFKTDSGRSVIVHVRQMNGEPLPFGAEVFDEQNQPVGVVGQAGRILARGVKDAGKLSVQWKVGGKPTQCSFPYSLPTTAKESTDSYQRLEATCTSAFGMEAGL